MSDDGVTVIDFDVASPSLPPLLLVSPIRRVVTLLERGWVLECGVLALVAIGSLAINVASPGSVVWTEFMDAFVDVA